MEGNDTLMEYKWETSPITFTSNFEPESVSLFFKYLNFNDIMQKGLDIINRYIYYSKELLQSPFTYSLENKWEKEFYCHYYHSVAEALLC